MTSPSLGMKSSLGVKGEEYSYVYLEESHAQRFQAAAQNVRLSQRLVSI